MFKKVIAPISTVLICVTVLISCSKSDPVQDDLLYYINNEVQTLVKLETKVATDYTAYTGENYVDDATLAVQLRDVIIPDSNELLTNAKEIVTSTEEVSELHSKYIMAVTKQHEAFTLLLQAAQTNDEALVQTVNEDLRNSDTISKEYLANLNSLKKKHNVVNE
jgi:hypothetical protein